jgi:hypothetical protein
MDIRVGEVAPVTSPAEKILSPLVGIEARLLAVRPPRSRGQRPPQDRSDRRRRDSPLQDPADARVLILMVPEGTRVPKDIDTKGYRVFIRFAKR